MKINTVFVWKVKRRSMSETSETFSVALARKSMTGGMGSGHTIYQGGLWDKFLKKNTSHDGFQVMAPCSSLVLSSLELSDKQSL